MVTFILEWRKMFPEHAKRPIIVAAESYGGHYAPAWTGAIMDYNDATSNPADRIPLAGARTNPRSLLRVGGRRDGTERRPMADPRTV